MSASYPKAIKTFTTKQDYTMAVMAIDVNDLQDEVVAIQTALGINPIKAVAPVATVNPDYSAQFSSAAQQYTSTAQRLAVLEAGLNFPVFSVWDNSVQTRILSGSILRLYGLPMPAPVYGNDPFGWYNGVDGFTIKRSGWYSLNASILWNANGASGTRRTVLMVGDSWASAEDLEGPVNSSAEFVSQSWIGIINAGTQIRIAVTQNCGTIQSVGYPRLSGFFIRGL